MTQPTLTGLVLAVATALIEAEADRAKLRKDTSLYGDATTPEDLSASNQYDLERGSMRVIQALAKAPLGPIQWSTDRLLDSIGAALLEPQSPEVGSILLAAERGLRDANVLIQEQAAQLEAMEAMLQSRTRQRDHLRERTKASQGFTYEKTKERATIFASDYRSIDIFLHEPGVAEEMRRIHRSVAQQKADGVTGELDEGQA